MGQQVDSNHSDPPDSYDAIGCLVLSVLFIGVFGVLYLFAHFAARFDCIEMPNGLLIGRATVFSKMYVSRDSDADIAIKFPDGRILRRGDNNIHFYDSESMGGSYPGNYGPSGNAFIYIENVGLFIESEQPEQYQYYWDKKMTELSGVTAENSNGQASGIGSNLFYVYLQFNGNPHEPSPYRRDWCPTAWFLPEK